MAMSEHRGANRTDVTRFDCEQRFMVDLQFAQGWSLEKCVITTEEPNSQ